MKICHYCREEKKLDEYYEKSHKACKYCFNVCSRIGHLRGFPNTFDYDDFEYVRMKFNISKDDIKLYHLDHFIPDDWGHGGSHLGNVYLLYGRYNLMKLHRNPFVAFEQIGKKYPTFQHTANQLIEHIANMNDLTIDELREFVAWCEANKREKVTSSKTSLEFWREK